MNEFWFVPRRYGYSSTPVTWEGWVMAAVFVAVVIAFAVIYHRRKKASLSNKVPWLALIGSTVVFVWVCAAKTNGNWAWRWGEAAPQVHAITSV